jgi:hypothetical protein
MYGYVKAAVKGHLSPMARVGGVVVIYLFILLYRWMGKIQSVMVCVKKVAVTPSGSIYLFFTWQAS